MSDILMYVMTGVVLVLTIVVLALAGSLKGLKKEIRDTSKDVKETRKETATNLLLNSQAIGTALNENAMQIEQRMENLRSGVEGRLEAIRQDNNAQLEKMRVTVDEKLQQTLENRLTQSFATVQKSLEQVYAGLGEMQNLAVGVGDLKKVLSNVKSRGIVGEIQLGAILEQILAPEQYAENIATIPGSSERVEYAVRMPGDGSYPVFLPIDAKFPGDKYAQLMDAYEYGNPELISEARKMLTAVMKLEAKDIHEKYIQVPYTTDFAVMFLPFEGLYAEAVNMGLMEALQSTYKVMIAGPSTMAALLNSLQMGFKTLAIQKNAGEVWKVLGSVKSEFDKFGEVLSITQQRLDQANKELDALVGTRTRQIQRVLKDVQTLGDGSASYRSSQSGYRNIEEL